MMVGIRKLMSLIVIKTFFLFAVQVWFEPSVYTVDEDSGTVTLIVMTNVPGGPPGGGVIFYTEDDSATCMLLLLLSLLIYYIVGVLYLAPGDFNAVSNFPVTFNQGSLITTVTVTVNDDSILEIDEVFQGRLIYTGTGTVEIVQDEANVTIVDNDGMFETMCDIIYYTVPVNLLILLFLLL